jgi:DNA-binding NtrC family response regulator
MNAEAQMERVELNICLAGGTISRDVELTRALAKRHKVSRLTNVDRLTKHFVLCESELEGVDVLVLDCGERKELLTDILSNVTERAPHLGVVLVNGGLTTMEIATALEMGAADYLAVPCTPIELEMLAERVEILGCRARDAKAAAGDGGRKQGTLPR